LNEALSLDLQNFSTDSRITIVIGVLGFWGYCILLAFFFVGLDLWVRGGDGRREIGYRIDGSV
jgi:hypothetical protein